MPEAPPVMVPLDQLPVALSSLAVIFHTRGQVNNEQWMHLAADEANRMGGIRAAYMDFERTRDLHELARAVGTILDRRDT